MNTNQKINKLVLFDDYHQTCVKLMSDSTYKKIDCSEIFISREPTFETKANKVERKKLEEFFERNKQKN